MNSTYVRENEVVARYVRGTLAPEDLAAFELYMLDHPEIVDDVEYEKGLQESVRADAFFSGTASARRQATRWWPGAQYATAAVALLSIVGAGYLLQQNAGLVAEIEALKAPSVMSLEVWLEPLRGAGSTIIEKRPAESLLLRVVISGNGLYDVRLRGIGHAFDWTQAGLTPNDGDALVLAVNDLPFGKYELTATPDAGAAITYTFDLLAAE